MRVLVCGSRDFVDSHVVYATLSGLSPLPKLIIEGGAGKSLWNGSIVGADRLAREWARVNGVACCTFHANWDRFRKSAGPIRNGWMLEYGKPDLVVAFPGGVGTANMVKQARDAGVEVKVVGSAGETVVR